MVHADDVQRYRQQRLRDMKRTVQAMRKEAGLTQQDIASALGCTRARIINIEDERKQAFYDGGEVELVATLCGKLPAEVNSLTDAEHVALAEFATRTRTSAALVTPYDCHLPVRLARRLATSGAFPADVTFSPDSTVLASFVDAPMNELRYEDEDEDEDEPPAKRPVNTLMCWDVQTGECISTMRQPHAELVVPISATLVVLAYSRPTKRISDSRDYEGDNHLLLKNPQTATVLRDIPVPDRIEALSVSPDGTRVAAWMPTTTLIGVWDIATGQQVLAVEFERLGGESATLGSHALVDRQFDRFPRTRKFNRWIMDFAATRFELLDASHLAVSFDEREACQELAIDDSTAMIREDWSFEYPSIPFPRLAHRRTADGQIAISKDIYNRVLNATEVELHYLIPGRHFPLDPHRASWTRLLPGWVNQYRIVDEGCVLGVQHFRMMYQPGSWSHQRIAIANIVTGRSVVLNDGGRLGRADSMEGPKLSSTGEYVAYWVTGNARQPVRLCLQRIRLEELRNHVTLATLFHQDAQRQRDEWRQIQQAYAEQEA